VGRGTAPEPAGSSEIHLFVYGTLRSGGGAAGLLRGCRLVGTGSGEGTLYDLGAYPALVLDGRGPVEGEVWRCPAEALDRLDEYEGVPGGLYLRVPVVVEGTDCWTYVAGPLLEPRLTPERRIPSGRWPPGAGTARRSGT
jgi:gamma-glutamylcyclotransferase (GGCT)/AIG2-like uncharacterized protein YtfP